MFILKKPYNYALYCLGFVLFYLLTLQLTLVLVGAYQWVHPGALLMLCQQGFYAELFIALTLTGLLATVFFGVIQKGFAYFISQKIALMLIGIFFCTSIGVSLFASISLPQTLDLLTFYTLHNAYPRLWKIFLLWQSASFISWFLLIGYRHYDKWFMPTVLGDAQFASAFAIKQGGFFQKTEESILIGQKYRAALYSNGFEHVLVFAPSGSGKTRSIGIPNLFHCPSSVVCNDVKLTMFKATSGYREKVLQQSCFCWNLSTETLETHRFNPLDLIPKKGVARMKHIQRIAHILIPDNKKSDPIWTQAARKLFKVAILYLMKDQEKKVTLGEINRLIKQPLFDDWLANLLEETRHHDSEFYQNGYSYLNNHEKTRSSILETFSGYFELFDDPLIDAATSHSDFDITKLRQEKMTIYIGFNDDDMERLSPLLTLFWQQLISVMIQKVPTKDEEPYPVLCLMDEFSSLGRIERLRRSLKLLREYRVRCVILLQYMAQMHEHYSHDEAKAFYNIKTKITLGCDDLQDAEYFSKLLGNKTIKLISGSKSQQLKGSTDSLSYNYQSVPLMRPEELMRLPADSALIMRTGFSPIQAQQFIWYQSSIMKKFARDSIMLPTQAL